MKKNRLGYALIIVMTLVAFVVARRNYTATTAGPGKVLLRIGHFTIDPQFRSFLEKAGGAYERIHPDVQIKQLDIPRPVYLQWQRTQIVGEMAPEIMQFAYFNAGVEDMVMHRFLVLDSWVEQPNPYRVAGKGEPMMWRDTFLDGLDSRDTYSEKLRAYFGIPLIMGGYRFFYNETMRREAGVKSGPWTFREFQQLADQLKVIGKVDAAGRPVLPMVGSNYASYSFFKMLFASVTQPLLFTLDRNYDLDVTGLDVAMGFLDGNWDYHTREILAAFNLIRESSTLMTAGFSQLGKQDGVLQFAQERGMSIGGAQVDMSYLRQLAPFEVREGSFPVPDKNDPIYGQYVLGPVTELKRSSSLTLGVLRSPLQERAVDFLQFLTGTEMMALLHQETGWRVSVQGDSTEADKLELKIGYPDGLYDTIKSRGNPMAFNRNVDLIFKPNGGPEVFADKMDAESPREIRTWLESQASTLRQTLRQQESVIIARWFMVPDHGESAEIDPDLAGFLGVNNRQEAELRSIRRFLRTHPQP